METIVQLLQTHAGRDKLMRTTSYVAMLVSGMSGETKAARDLGVIAKQISAARTVGRLFDDLPMLVVTKTFGFGAQEKDPVTRILQLLSNAANQLFFPIEHIAWGADQEILPIASVNWWTASVSCWASSLLFGILKSLRMIGRLNNRRARLVKERKLESPDQSGEVDASFRQSIAEVKQQQLHEYINVLKNGCDLLNAVSWLPEGFLWAGKFSRAQNGFLGLMSSSLGLYQLIKAQKQKTQ